MHYCEEMEELPTSSAYQNPEFLKDPSEQIKHLQLEHQGMLRGLQDEIARLQQQSSSLQQQMIFQGILPSIEDTLKLKLEDLDAKLATNSQECDNLRTELHQSQKLVEDLQERIRQQDERYREDVSARNLIVVRLRREVEEKTKALETLTSLLHPGPETRKAKVPHGQAQLKSGAENRSLPSVWTPTATPSMASAPIPTASLYNRFLKFQPKTNETLMSQCRPRLGAVEKTLKKQSGTTSAHCQNGNFPSRTFLNPKAVSGGLSLELLPGQRSQSRETAAISKLSSSIHVAKSKDLLAKH